MLRMVLGRCSLVLHTDTPNIETLPCECDLESTWHIRSYPRRVIVHGKNGLLNLI